jgi:hypothetical protein
VCDTPGCGFEMLLPFSCKTRGVCGSCDSRRMADTAAHLVDRVLPQIPYRQWTMSFPRRVRFALARSGELLSEVLRAFLRTVFAWQRRSARQRGIVDGKIGAVTFAQRMGGTINLNVHFHCTLPDGVFSVDEHGQATFVPLDPPSDDDVHNLTGQVVRRVAKILARHEAEADAVPDALAAAQAASVQSAQHLLDNPPGPCTRHGRSHTPRPHKTRCAFIDGFSLHADVRTHSNDRLGLERLLRYGGRPSIAHDRLSVTDDGRVRYRLRRPAPSGATEWLGEPVEFLSKLATLIPPPRQNALRYHGCFAPKSGVRARIVPRVPADPAPAPRPASAVAPSLADPDAAEHAVPDLAAPSADSAAPATLLTRRLDWASLLARVFRIDVTRCPRCPGRLRVLAFITQPDIVVRILDHLGLSTSGPSIEPARGPPQTDFADDFADRW